MKSEVTAKVWLITLALVTIVLLPFGNQFFSYNISASFKYNYAFLLKCMRYINIFSGIEFAYTKADVVFYFNIFLYILIISQAIISFKCNLKIKYLYSVILIAFPLYIYFTLFLFTHSTFR